jgi:hypothetical protein
LKVYVVPFVSPVTAQLPDAPVTVQVFVASPTAVTVYEVGGAPPPMATVTVALASPGTAVGVVGVVGTASAFFAALADDARELTATKRFAAATLQALLARTGRDLMHLAIATARTAVAFAIATLYA